MNVFYTPIAKIRAARHCGGEAKASARSLGDQARRFFARPTRRAGCPSSKKKHTQRQRNAG